MTNVVENQDPATPDNQDPVTTPADPATPATTPSGWMSNLSPDLQGWLKSKGDGNAVVDTPEGLNSVITSYANLEKLIGHEKVPIPKDINDVEGWNRFSKAMGIPDKAEGYGLADAKLPEAMKGLTIDKNKFAEVVNAHKLTPAQAQGLWKVYNEINMNQYAEAMKKHEQQITETVNRLIGEWGDAYDTNVELGQMVINKFSDDQEMNDYITAVLTQDPRGVKFLAKIGDQFAENKIGEFQMKRFSLTPEEMQEQVDKDTKDLNGPYMNQEGKFTAREHQAAVDRHNFLIASIQKAKGQA